MAVPRLQGVPCDNADSYAQEFFKVLEQADVIKEGGARLEVHEQVKIAVRASFSPCDRAEHGDPMSPAFSARRRGSPRGGSAARPWSAHHRSPFNGTAAYPGARPDDAVRSGQPLADAAIFLSEAVRSLHLTA